MISIIIYMSLSLGVAGVPGAPARRYFPRRDSTLKVGVNATIGLLFADIFPMSTLIFANLGEWTVKRKQAWSSQAVEHAPPTRPA